MLPTAVFALGFLAPPLARQLPTLRVASPSMSESDDALAPRLRASADLQDKIGARWEALKVTVAEGAEDTLSPVQKVRDSRLAERDTRAWCLDRCLATGFCDTLEDLWAMNTEQVIAFCEQCAGEDECALDYDKAEEYLGHLSFAAWEGSAA